MDGQELAPITHNYKASRGHGACQIYALDPHVVRFHPENPGSDVLGEERINQSDPRSLHSRLNTFFKRQDDSPARWVSQCVNRDA
jgi:hypothetical protein